MRDFLAIYYLVVFLANVSSHFGPITEVDLIEKYVYTALTIKLVNFFVYFFLHTFTKPMFL